MHLWGTLKIPETEGTNRKLGGCASLAFGSLTKFSVRSIWVKKRGVDTNIFHHYWRDGTGHRIGYMRRGSLVATRQEKGVGKGGRMG